MWNTIGTGVDPRMQQNAQQMMAQKLMDPGPAPVANSTQQSSTANILAQAAKGLMNSQLAQQGQPGQGGGGDGQSPGWMDWITRQFSGTPNATGMGVGAGTGSLY